MLCSNSIWQMLDIVLLIRYTKSKPQLDTLEFCTIDVSVPCLRSYNTIFVTQTLGINTCAYIINSMLL